MSILKKLVNLFAYNLRYPIPDLSDMVAIDLLTQYITKLEDNRHNHIRELSKIYGKKQAAVIIDTEISHRKDQLSELKEKASPYRVFGGEK